MSKGGIGLPGGLLVAGVVGLGGFALLSGIKEAYRSYKRIDGIEKGYSDTTVSNSWIHGMQGLGGLATAIGGVTLFASAPVGLSLIGAGLASSITMGVVKHFMGGMNWFTYPKLAPWPLSSLLEVFSNRGVYEAN